MKWAACCETEVRNIVWSHLDMWGLGIESDIWWTNWAHGFWILSSTQIHQWEDIGWHMFTPLIGHNLSAMSVSLCHAYAHRCVHGFINTHWQDLNMTWMKSSTHLSTHLHDIAYRHFMTPLMNDIHNNHMTQLQTHASEYDQWVWTLSSWIMLILFITCLMKCL